MLEEQITAFDEEEETQTLRMWTQQGKKQQGETEKAAVTYIHYHV